MKKVVKKVVSPLIAVAMTLSIGVGATACSDFDHSHHFSEKYTYNEYTHWHPCDAREGCGAKYAEKEHDFVEGVCSVCEYEEGTTPTPPEIPVIPPENPDDPNPPVIEPEDPTVQYTVTFETNGGTPVEAQTVNKGATLASVTSTNGNKYLVGWYTDSACTKPWNMLSSVMGDMTLYAKWETLDESIVALKSYNESLAVTFKEGNPAGAKVEYRLANGSVWTKVDKELVRADGANSRVDIVGLAEGSYKVKITLSSGATVETPDIAVTSYDRSGYAHFKYTEGVGAYNDDGTLKDNAIVIYVTDENKDYVMKEACAKYDALNMFKVPGSDWGNKDAESIGWWLNNNQFSASNAGSSKNKVPSNTYDAANGNNLAFKQANATHPIVIRFIGTVTTPEGCTAYNDTKEGGGVGDNGHMARLKNYKNITLEGIGEDAVIQGWGFHFVIGTDAVNGQGKSFEVRNLTFDKYPEDAIGMEGQQSGSSLTAAVERCWIHHNVFLPGYCANPAESDKAEGDGSCDFKRGEYLTCSYNYFTDCHKTNLVGSSDSSLQYNLSYHHNWWHNCGSRIPLARQANIHFYNNYVSTDTNGANISYVASIRANAYLFSEANYYSGCKSVAEKGTGKGWNNAYLGCFGNHNLDDVATREATVSNSCKHYSGTDLSKFDTDPNLFYYDAQNKKSDCLLDDPVTARAKAIKGAGVNGWGENNPKKGSNATWAVKEFMQNETPADYVPVPEDDSELTVDFKTPPKGVKFGGTVSSGNLKSTKGEGQLVIINLKTPAAITASSGDAEGPYLISANGKILAKIEGSVTVEVPAGVYLIVVNKYCYDMKQSTISSLSFKSAKNSTEFKFEALNEAIDALPATITAQSGTPVITAQTALNALNAQELAKYKTDEAARYSKLENAITTYNKLCVDPVIALINAIGTVNEDSGTKIANARSAYNKLTAAQKQLVTNYGTLTAAENAYVNYEVAGVNKAIANLADASTATTEAQIRSLLEQYETVNEMYSSLDPTQKSQISNYSKVTSGITALEGKLAPYSVRDMIAALPAKADITIADAADVKEARDAYDALTADQKTAVGNISKLTDAEAAIKEIQNTTIECTFLGGSPSDPAIKSTGSKQSAKNTAFTVNAYGGELASGLKLESSTELTITVATKMTLKLYFDGTGNVKIDGTKVKPVSENGDNVLTVTIEAGKTVKVTKGDSINLYYATLTPAA